MLICHERKKIFKLYNIVVLYTSDFVLFLNKYLGFLCFKCLKYVTPFRASENEDRGPHMLVSSQFWKLESLIYIWLKFHALITFSTYHAIFVVYQANYVVEWHSKQDTELWVVLSLATVAINSINLLYHRKYFYKYSNSPRIHKVE